MNCFDQSISSYPIAQPDQYCQGGKYRLMQYYEYRIIVHQLLLNKANSQYILLFLLSLKSQFWDKFPNFRCSSHSTASV